MEQFWMTEAAMAKSELEILKKRCFQYLLENNELKKECEEYTKLKKLVQDNIILKDDWDRFMMLVKLTKENN